MSRRERMPLWWRLAWFVLPLLAIGVVFLIVTHIRDDDWFGVARLALVLFGEAVVAVLLVRHRAEIRSGQAGRATSEPEAGR